MDPLAQLIDKKILSILSVFGQNKKKPMYLREISKLSKISPATTFRILNKLCQKKIIAEIKVSKFKFYQYNGDKEIDKVLK